MGLGFGRNLGHSMVILIIPVEPWGRGRLINVSALRLLGVELVGRLVAHVAVLFHVAIVWIGSGCHRDVRGEGVGRLVEAIVPGSVDLLSFAV